MAGFRDDFYYRVGRDYHEHMESSFIYGYVRREREQNLRLKIKEELFCLADTPLSKGRYTRFLVKAMLTDKNLAAGLDRIGTLPEFAEKATSAADGIGDGSIKDILTDLSEYLDRHPVLDIEVNVLRALTAEIMESFEFDGEKKNPYVQLTSIYRDLDYGWTDSAGYIKALLDFFAMNSKYIPGKSDMAVWQEKATVIWGKDVFAGLRKSADKLGRLAQLAVSDETAFGSFAESLMERNYAADLTERVQREILRVEINTLLYDAGFSVDNGTYRLPRKKEKSMDILDAYFKYVGGNPFSGRGSNSEIPRDYLTWDAYYDACDDLRDTINSYKNDSEHSDMFMPMWLDREVGGGVFLIGRNKFEESVDVHIDSNCELGVVYFLGVEDGRAFEFAAFQTSSYDRDAFPAMEEAVSWFQNYDYRDDALEEYRNCNSDAPAGCPDVFKKFFECYDEESYEETYEDSVTDDDIAETLAEFDREAEDERRQKALRSVMMSSKGVNVLRK